MSKGERRSEILDSQYQSLSIVPGEVFEGQCSGCCWEAWRGSSDEAMEGEEAAVEVKMDLLLERSGSKTQVQSQIQKDRYCDLLRPQSRQPGEEKKKTHKKLAGGTASCLSLSAFLHRLHDTLGPPSVLLKSQATCAYSMDRLNGVS